MPANHGRLGAENAEVWSLVKNTQSTRRTVIAAASALTVAIMGVTGVGIANAHRNVTIEVDGVPQSVSGFFSTVEGALGAAGVQPGEHDLVAPETHESVEDGSTVVVRTASPYTINIDGTTKVAWSTAASVTDLLGQFGSTGVTYAADRSNARAALPILTEGGTIIVEADGVKKSVEASATDTAASLLKKAGVTASPIDRVSFAATDKGVTLRVVRVTRGTSEKVETLEAPVQEREDDTLEQGETRVIEEGSEGKVVTKTYKETIGGKTTVETVVDTKRHEPVARVIAIGTKAPEPVAPPASSAPASASASEPAPAASSVGGDVWAALAACESGGNPSTNTGNGYYGLYQFSLPTWQAVGGSGLPSEASAAEQTMRAQILQSRAGWGQWPACSASLGLY